MAANPGVPEPALKLDTERTPTETIVRCTGKITVETAALFRTRSAVLFRKPSAS